MGSDNDQLFWNGRDEPQKPASQVRRMLSSTVIKVIIGILIGVAYATLVGTVASSLAD